MNKKAQIHSQFNIFTFMIVAFLAVVLFAGLIYAMGKINDVMHQAGMSNEVNAGKAGYVNMTQASDQIFGQVNQSIQSLKMVAIVYILCEALMIIFMAGFMRTHPFLFIVYVLIVLLAVIFAPAISNAYQNLLDSGIYDNGLQQFSASNFILLNLPTVVLIIGTLGAVFMFIQLIRTEGETNIH